MATHGEYLTFQIPPSSAGVVLLWGNRSATTMIDGSTLGRSTDAGIDPMLRALMVARLRYIADELEADA